MTVRFGIIAGRTLPAWTLRVAAIVVAATAFATIPTPYAWAAVALAVAGAVLPATLATWGALAVIALGQLAHPAAAGDWQPHVALLAVHVLHVIGGLCLALPARGRLQVRSLAAPARRLAVIQLPAQAVLAAVLLAGSSPLRGLAPAGVAAMVTSVCAVVAVLLLRLLLARR